jgi:hypothetical protein
MNFVFFAPVCLFPVPPPAGQLLNRVEPPSIRFPGFIAEGRYLDELEAVLLVTIVALFPELRQGLVSKLLKSHPAPETKALSTRHSALDQRATATTVKC